MSTTQTRSSFDGPSGKLIQRSAGWASEVCVLDAGNLIISDYFNSLLVLLCHKLLLAAGTSREPSCEGMREANSDCGDGVGDVAFGSARGCRGVDNLWVGEVL